MTTEHTREGHCMRYNGALCRLRRRSDGVGTSHQHFVAEAQTDAPEHLQILACDGGRKQSSTKVVQSSECISLPDEVMNW